MAFLDRFFEHEQMDGDGRCPVYLHRWTLLKLPGKRGVYLHHFVGDDWSRDLHDHPKRFISIGLLGGYIEWTPRRTPDPSGLELLPAHMWRTCRVYIAPWIRTFPAEHIHRITLMNGRPCWTLVIVLKTVRQWGFWHAGEWIQWRKYVNSDTATQMKSCP